MRWSGVRRQARLAQTSLALAVWAVAAPVLAQGASPSGQSGGPNPSPAGATVYFIDLKDGAVIPPSTTIHFGLRGMGVAPAGVQKENAGHHHLLIDTDLPPLDRPIPNDFNHLHFGAGQTEARVTLPLGTHRLQLLLADDKHIPHDPPVLSKPITVTVTATGRPPRAKAKQRRRG